MGVQEQGPWNCEVISLKSSGGFLVRTEGLVFSF